LLDRRELRAELRREVAEAFRVVIVTARQVQLEGVEDRRGDFEEAAFTVCLPNAEAVDRP
jgi:hypothetical protein